MAADGFSLALGVTRVLRSTVATALVALAVVASACGSKDGVPTVGAGDPDKILYERGAETLNNRKWFTAREYFKQIVDGYPQSVYRADAKLGLADTYLGENSPQAIVLALNEYREFLSFYPTHPRADYAQYKLAMCHYTQMAKPERDQSETKEALTEFAAFFERFPNSPLAAEAKTRQREARDRLSESEYRVGLFYYRSKWYPGAIDRLQSVLKQDPEFTGRDAVYFYLADSLTKVTRAAEAAPYFQRILDEFVQSDFLEPARRRLEELKTPAAPRAPESQVPREVS